MHGTDPGPDPDANYYEILGISQDATEEAIITAYREKIKEYHPDLNESANAQEMTQLVSEAKAILTDETKRAQYDRRLAREADGATADPRSSVDEPTSKRTDRTHERRTESRTQGRTTHTRNHRNRNENRRQSRTRTQTRSRHKHGHEDIDGDGNHTRRWTDLTQGEGIVSRLLAVLWGLLSNIDQRFGHPTKRITPFRYFFGLPNLRAVANNPRRWLLAPTPIRLVIAAVLAVPVLTLLGTGALSPEQELGVVVAALIVSYAGYEWAGPFSFESREPRSKPAFAPGVTVPAYPMVVMNLVGYRLFLAGSSVGAPFGGFGWTFIALGVVMYLTVVVGAVLVLVCTMLTLPSKERGILYGIKAGAALTPVAVFLIAFTRWRGESRLAAAVRDIGPAPETVWVSQHVVGPLDVGTLVTFLIGLVMLACLASCILYMFRFFTRVPRWDRYQHGYRIRPGVWNLLVTLPLALAGWLLISGQNGVWLSVSGIQVHLDLVIVSIGLLLLPIPLAIGYGVRRQGERWVYALVTEIGDGKTWG